MKKTKTADERLYSMTAYQLYREQWKRRLGKPPREKREEDDDQRA